METQLTNTASVLGSYNNIPTAISSQALVISMIDGLTATKTADKMIWADGVLTYAIVVDNQATEAYTTPIITDILDTTLVSFVEDSVTIEGVKVILFSKWIQLQPLSFSKAVFNSSLVKITTVFSFIIVIISP